MLLGVYGRVHDPAREQTISLFFSGTLNLKAWVTTLILVLALFQVASALRIYGKVKVPATAPAWLGDAHRLSGTLAFFCSLPVAYHCLWSIGFATDTTTRALVHSILGCAFYGAFVAKVIAVRNHHLPGWALPVIGGLTFTVLVGVWLTSSLWFFTNVGFPEI